MINYLSRERVCHVDWRSELVLAHIWRIARGWWETWSMQVNVIEDVDAASSTHDLSGIGFV